MRRSTRLKGRRQRSDDEESESEEEDPLGIRVERDSAIAGVQDLGTSVLPPPPPPATSKKTRKRTKKAKAKPKKKKKKKRKKKAKVRSPSPEPIPEDVGDPLPLPQERRPKRKRTPETAPPPPPPKRRRLSRSPTPPSPRPQRAFDDVSEDEMLAGPEDLPGAAPIGEPLLDAHTHVARHYEYVREFIMKELAPHLAMRERPLIHFARDVAGAAGGALEDYLAPLPERVQSLLASLTLRTDERVALHLYEELLPNLVRLMAEEMNLRAAERETSPEIGAAVSDNRPLSDTRTAHRFRDLHDHLAAAREERWRPVCRILRRTHGYLIGGLPADDGEGEGGGGDDDFAPIGADPVPEGAPGPVPHSVRIALRRAVAEERRAFLGGGRASPLEIYARYRVPVSGMQIFSDVFTSAIRTGLGAVRRVCEDRTGIITLDAILQTEAFRVNFVQYAATLIARAEFDEAARHPRGVYKADASRGRYEDTLKRLEGWFERWRYEGGVFRAVKGGGRLVRMGGGGGGGGGGMDLLGFVMDLRGQS